MAKRKAIICGAGGRDFHNFNTVYRDDDTVEVVAFTATQIPGIADRTYPASLAGTRYPSGIPIVDETGLEALIIDQGVDEVVFAYSDLVHADVMHVASRALAAGAEFRILGPRATCLKANRPVIAISAVRTGCGKSQIARFVARSLKDDGQRVAAIRHAMPYGDLARQAVQRFATAADMDRAECTLEEREEYEPHVNAGIVVFAGVDYTQVLASAEDEADIVVWDGGNNDFPFVQPDVHVVVVDALRADHLSSHFPGEATLRMADIAVINKVNAATPAQCEDALAGIRAIDNQIPIVLADSPVTLEDPDAVAGKRVLVVEDGPTTTHGGMPHGAGFEALKNRDVEIVDPRPFATREILEVFRRYPHIGPVLPAVGYSPHQVAQLAETIEASDADVVVIGTPIDFAADVTISKPVVRVRYEHRDHGEPLLMDLIRSRLG